jgi:hypothetical protein
VISLSLKIQILEQTVAIGVTRRKFRTRLENENGLRRLIDG